MCNLICKLNSVIFGLLVLKIQIHLMSVRIWGEQGQTALEKASICLLNCGPTGSETLKNLVLGGIGSITVVDGSKVNDGDLGNNFMCKIIFYRNNFMCKIFYNLK